MLYYSITPYSLQQHLWEVCLEFEQNEIEPFSLSLPNWVPGSYMIRDFSKNIVSITATCNDANIKLEQIDKNSWQPNQFSKGQWIITYLVYALDLSVRGSWLTTDRGFFDGACVFLRHNQKQFEPCHLTVKPPENWQLASAMPVVHSGFQVANYRELIDYPFEMGATLHSFSFHVNDIPHRIVISGHFEPFDEQKLLADVHKICASQIAFFNQSAPFTEYLFLVHVGDRIYGGLEHKNSSALLIDRNSLPNFQQDNTDEYINLLGLFSHEYFHAWNVKSIQPKAFHESQLNQEAYSQQLWAFEGITSYYDNLFLVRSKAITPTQYLRLLAQNITQVYRYPGRKHQTLAESSFNAWTKYYKPNENTPNAVVSYYQKGALAALCLDSYLRQHSHHRVSLDTIMQSLYQDYLVTHQPLDEGEWEKRAAEISQLNLQEVFQQLLHSVEDLPIQEALRHFGVDCFWHSMPESHLGDIITIDTEHMNYPAFGAKFQQHTNSITLTHVLNHSTAERAGLIAGDEIIALNHYRIHDFKQQWRRLTIGQTYALHYFRHGVIYQTDITVQAANPYTALLQIHDTELLKIWLE